MVTFEWFGGFWFVCLDGKRVACADTKTRNRAYDLGHKPSKYAGIRGSNDLEVVCLMLGPEYHAAYLEKWPDVKPAPRTAAEKRRDRARYYRELKGW